MNNNKNNEKKFDTGIEYKNKKWRPSVFIDKSKQEIIEARISELGYKSFNEYVCALIDKDMKG